MRPYTIEANIPVWFSWNRQEGAQESRNQAISTSVGSSEQLHEIIATRATEVLGVCRRGERELKWKTKESAKNASRLPEVHWDKLTQWIYQKNNNNNNNPRKLSECVCVLAPEYCGV